VPVSETHLVAWAHRNSFEGFTRLDETDAQRMVVESGGSLTAASVQGDAVLEPGVAPRIRQEPPGNCPCTRCEKANRCRSECGAFRAYVGSGRWIAAPTETKR
jgi:hypothetical protein